MARATVTTTMGRQRHQLNNEQGSRANGNGKGKGEGKSKGKGEDNGKGRDL